MPGPDSSSLLEELVDAAQRPERVDEVALRFRALLEQGRAAHPEVTTSPRSVAAVVAAVHDGEPSLTSWLGQCDAGEVWLAAGCQDRDPASVRTLDQRYIAPLDAALASTRLDADQIGEIKQRVREKLLGADDGGMMRLVKYCGRGRLAAMAKVIAVRSAVDMARVSSRHPERAANGDALAAERLVDGQLGPELSAMDEQQRRVLKSAFESAVGGLPPLDRGLLRLHLVERLAIDEIAALHNVHRATAARWLTRIRGRLGERTRDVLRDELRLADTELRSFLQLAKTGLDLSLSRVLASKGADD